MKSVMMIKVLNILLPSIFFIQAFAMQKDSNEKAEINKEAKTEIKGKRSFPFSFKALALLKSLDPKAQLFYNNSLSMTRQGFNNFLEIITKGVPHIVVCGKSRKGMKRITNITHAQEIAKTADTICYDGGDGKFMIRSNTLSDNENEEKTESYTFPTDPFSSLTSEDPTEDDISEEESDDETQDQHIMKKEVITQISQMYI